MKNTSNKSKKIRKGDKVVAIAGNYRGQMGTVLSCTAKGAIVQGLNVRKKHVKASEQNKTGGIIEMEKPIAISNLKVCVADDQPVKLKVKKSSNGARDLVYCLDNKEQVHRSLKK